MIMLMQGMVKILNIKSAITIEAWINPAVAQEKCYDEVSGNYGVMSKVGGPANSANWSWQLRYGAPVAVVIWDLTLMAILKEADG